MHEWPVAHEPGPRERGRLALVAGGLVLVLLAVAVAVSVVA